MQSTTIYSYKELIVWQKAVALSVAIYELTERFPREEVYGLVSQMRRAAVSIPSNIAEGRLRGTRKDFLQFLRIAHGSSAELETQIIIAKSLTKTKDLSYSKAESLLLEIEKMLRSMMRKMNPKAHQATEA